jgi:hypothetical protein
MFAEMKPGTVRFYIGLHHPSDARHFERACVSVNALARRRKPLPTPIILDSGAFTEIGRHGGYRSGVRDYAAIIRRLRECCEIEVAVSQDYMCEPFILKKTGLTVADHQRLTIERYDDLVAADTGVPIMPVLQGYKPSDYARHVEAYGGRLPYGAWVGVGSVCKRNGSPESALMVFACIKVVRPDLKLHGFGIKKTTLQHPLALEFIATADSMAWSFHARRNGRGRDANDWREAARYLAQLKEAVPGVV